MRAVMLRWGVVFALALSVFVLAQTFPPGFPSPPSGGGAAVATAGYWYDAGTYFGSEPAGIFANEYIMNPNTATYSGDFGQALRLHAKAFSVYPQYKPTEVMKVTANSQYPWYNSWPSIAFSNGPNASSAFGRISGDNGQSTIQGSAHYKGLTLSAETIGFVSDDHQFRIASFENTYAPGIGRLVMETTANNDALRLTTGARAHLGSGTNDYLASDGTGIETPGYLEAGDYVQGTAGFCSGAVGTGTAFALFPAASTVLGRSQYDSTNFVWRWSALAEDAGTAWHSASRLSLMGGRHSAVALAEGVILGTTYVAAPSTTTGISCDWAGGVAATDGGTQGLVLFLSVSTYQGDGGEELYFPCRCSVGACDSALGSGSCACESAIPAGSTAKIRFLKVDLDGGIFTDCSVNPTDIDCGIN